MNSDPPPAPSNPRPSDERRAVVRIDAEPGGKKFQGVWLELPGGERWVIDYRPRPPWRWFEDTEVRVSGHCYEPFGQAIGAVHFEVTRMRFATARPGARPYLELGPEVLLRGRFVAQAAPAGSKRAGASELRFEAEDGTSYALAGDHPSPSGELVRVTARTVIADPSYVARTAGPDLWIAAVHAADHEPDPAHARRSSPCPK